MSWSDSGKVPVSTHITIFYSPSKEEVLACVTDKYLHLVSHHRSNQEISVIEYQLPDCPKWLVYLLVDLFTGEICGVSLTPHSDMDTTMYKEISQSVNTVYDSSWLKSLSSK